MKQRILALMLTGVVIASACRKRDAGVAENLVNFESTEQGMLASEPALTIKVKSKRATDRDIVVILNLTEQGAVYGTHYTTNPAAVAGKISLTIPSGNNEASFTVSKSSNAFFAGDEKVVFDIYSSASPVIIGNTKQLTLSFAELIAVNTNLTINGGGALYPNKTFIDISSNRETPVNRSKWDLGFYTGADDFRVILNSSSAMMARQINKNDLTQVTAADTLGFATDVLFNQSAPTTTSLPYIDYPDGNLSRTAIGAISANASENKVYIINRGFAPGSPAPARGWRKVRVIRSASGGYTLQHADIASTTFQEVNISKDEAYFFRYASFENGVVAVEPEKKKWDIAWTYFSNVTNFGAGEVPYLFQDFILINRNVEVAKVMTTTKAYAEFMEADLAGLTFQTSQVAIGSDWRSGGGPGVSPAVRTDRYYIIKDGDGNYYKVRFTALTQNGERGFPAFEATLVKRG